MQNGVSSPAILNMLGILSSRPCDAVKCSEGAGLTSPWPRPRTAHDCIS
jgi:hypothetical protein